jgi:hypothetical protein
MIIRWLGLLNKKQARISNWTRISYHGVNASPGGNISLQQYSFYLTSMFEEGPHLLCECDEE